MRFLWTVLLCACCGSALGNPDSLMQLDQDYWAWRAREQPFSEDDIPRIERPADYSVDWSPRTIGDYRMALQRFEDRWRALTPPSGSERAVQVDHALIGSALARARYELDMVQSWARNPTFYIDQTLGSVYALLLTPAPITAERQEQILHRLEGIPATLRHAHENLSDIRAPFLKLATDALAEIDTRLARLNATLSPVFDDGRRERLANDITQTITALNDYRHWLLAQQQSARSDTAIGPEAFNFFLHRVALLTLTPDEMQNLARAEWARAVTFEAVEQTRLSATDAPRLFESAQAQIAAERVREAEIRRFLGERHLLTVPQDLPHYRNELLPDYLEPLAFLGVSDDLTSASRAQDDAVSYIRTPSPDLPYFYLSTARDPRPIVVHEGVPGHFFQLALGWRHPDPIRRHYYDSTTNEGIGFYAEEMLLQAGLFDDQPSTRATIYNFMRLRALRVEVDIRLALGDYTIDQAADYLAHTVPMDKTSARDEAASFAATPGQGLSYQIGKSQIVALLAEAKRREGDRFSVQAFHDRLWKDGNVPFELLRYEWWGDSADSPRPRSP
jgi:Bacterial protein of unknown function (DUF885)